MPRRTEPPPGSVTDPEDEHLRRLRLILRRAREDRSVTGKELAEVLGVHENTVFSWERYDRHPPIDAYSKWAAALGYTMIVELDSGRGTRPRTSILVQSGTAAQVARAVDQLSAGDQVLILTLVRRIAGGMPM